ncbi:hypothetical protein CVT24_004089 [Panaeolus cyanescens]|uniref:Uncharacterized protein n=1 Tax=Panaeolus cyanescens TaxID=181874 RepID=A0A409Y5Y2_9AGAR|nr:hypothetical protein CVT24_004089 [Panaeolus cyanescens]
MVSQAILGVRAFNLSRRSKYIGWCFIVLYFTATVVSALQLSVPAERETPPQRRSVMHWAMCVFRLHTIQFPDADFMQDNCRAFNPVQVLGAWIFYAIAIIYDVLTTGISLMPKTFDYKDVKTNPDVSKPMLYDGLGYLVVLTAVNILNLILYRTSAEIQVRISFTAGASLAYCVSWIMSQRLLIHLYGMYTHLLFFFSAPNLHLVMYADTD